MNVAKTDPAKIRLSFQQVDSQWIPSDDERMRLNRLVRYLLLLLQFLRVWFRPRADLAVENLALRQQVAVLKNSAKRPRLHGEDRLFWVLLSRFWKRWNASLMIVKPETVVGWHRKGFPFYWSFISRRGRRPGRPRIEKELRDLVRRLAFENVTWGAPRVHAELLKLGLKVSERTVSRYMPKRKPTDDQLVRWKTFLKLHAQGIAAMDFFTVPTATFLNLYVFFVIHHASRKMLHFDVSYYPDAVWVIQNLREAFPWDGAPRHLIFDRDSKFNAAMVHAVTSFGTKPVRTGYRCPFQNPIAERWIRSCREDILDHVVVLGQKHLRKLVKEYIRYYQDDRCHDSLDKDAPISREVQARPSRPAKVIALPRLYGLHHRYEWKQAA